MNATSGRTLSPGSPCSWPALYCCPAKVDLGVKLYPGIVAAPLILGTLAGCGGRLIADALLHGYAEIPGLAELTSPGFVSRSAFMAAATYYVLGHVLQLLPLSAAAGLVVTTLVSGSAAAVHFHMTAVISCSSRMNVMTQTLTASAQGSLGSKRGCLFTQPESAVMLLYCLLALTIYAFA